MIIRLNLKLFSWAVLTVIVLAIVVYILLNINTASSASTQLPSDVVHALEYFNAANTNKTIIVPSSYYSQASLYSINNNKVISNDTEYANILFNNKTYPGINFILIEMNQLNFLKQLYSEADLTSSYNLTVFPTVYKFGNLSSSERNCYDYGNNTDAFIECEIYISYSIPNPLNSSQKINGTKNFGYIALAAFPASSTLYTINASIFYNGQNRTYIASFVNSSEANFLKGLVFVYENVTTFYLSPAIMKTFYGREMFLPSTMLNNVFDSYGEARTIILS